MRFLNIYIPSVRLTAVGSTEQPCHSFYHNNLAMAAKVADAADKQSPFLTTVHIFPLTEMRR